MRPALEKGKIAPEPLQTNLKTGKTMNIKFTTVGMVLFLS